MRVKKLKTYVITVAVKFPKKGIVVPEPTGFKKKILSGEKKHTLRQNYQFWRKRIDEVNKGNAILSVRQWSGKPYNSKQIEIKQFKQGELNYQRVVVGHSASKVSVSKDGDGFTILSSNKIKKLAENDGLTLEQFKDWFKNGAEDGIIIHWTKLNY